MLCVKRHKWSYNVMEYIISSETAKSRNHKKNEDSFVCGDKYIVVADGMGGEACGDVASDIAVSNISSYLEEFLPKIRTEEDIRKLTLSAISLADREIQEYIAMHPESDGMGTTVVILVHDEQNLYVAWCGDSRCYYYRPAEGLVSLTKDHSYVQQLIDEGRISEDESFSHPDNNLITRFIGGGAETCQPEFVSVKIQNDGSVILCSDGLSGYCKIKEIERELKTDSKYNISRRLLELAIRKGSDDDITIVSLTPKGICHKPKKSLLGWFKILAN